MALSGVTFNGKELLVSELDTLPPLERKAALRETSARDKRALATEFAEKSEDLRGRLAEAQADLQENYLSPIRRIDDAIFASCIMYDYDPQRGKLEAMRERFAALYNVAAEPVRSMERSAADLDGKIFKLTWGARKDAALCFVQKTAGRIGRLLGGV